MADALAQTQPCPTPGDCAELSVQAPASALRLEPFSVGISFAPGAEDGQTGGLDDIAALTFSLAIPGLELVDCASPTEDGITSSIVVSPALSQLRVIIENTICNAEASRPCLCPGTGETRAPYVNIAVFGPKPEGGEIPDELPTIPAASLLTLNLRAGNSAISPVALHVFAETDGAGLPKPPFGARVSVGDTNSVDVSVSSGVSRIRTVDDSIAILEPSTPTLTLTTTRTLTPTRTLSPTRTTTPSSTPSITSTATVPPSATRTPTSPPATATSPPTVPPTATAPVPPTLTLPPTVTRTSTPFNPTCPTATATRTPTPPEATPTATGSLPVSTPTIPAPPTATDTVVGPTATVPPAACPGDCSGNREISVEERKTAVRIALLDLPLSECDAADANRDLAVTVEEIVAAVAASCSE